MSSHIIKVLAVMLAAALVGMAGSAADHNVKELGQAAAQKKAVSYTESTDDPNKNESEEDNVQKNDQLQSSSEQKSDVQLTKEESDQMNIQVGKYNFTVILADNSSTQALKEYLADGPVTLKLDDYAGMEKVGALGTSLPRNDEQIATEIGDIILYQGNQICIYYGNNTWKFTRLGKIANVEDLKAALGTGSVEVTLSLN